MSKCSSSFASELSDLVSALYKESHESTEPSAERCEDILHQIESLFTGKNKGNKITISILESTQAGKTLAKMLKSFKRYRRSADTVLSQKKNNAENKDKSSVENEWEIAVTKCEKLVTCWKETAQTEAENNAKHKKAKANLEMKGSTAQMGLPTSVSSLHSRLVKQKKEIYKNPPVLPPPTIVIHTLNAPLPKRHKTTGELIFKAPESVNVSDTPSLSKFRPNLSPEQILQGGAFGGTYFRSITSAITNQSYPSTKVISSSVKPEWIQNLDPKIYLSSQTYRSNVNKFKAKCGGSLGMWESSGWISDVDPYGWFQWYCRFYAGRRCSDDERQIGRWCKIGGEKGRFLSQLCNKCLRAGKKAGDVSISPVIRQTLWHWGVEVTDFILERHRKRIEGK